MFSTPNAADQCFENCVANAIKVIDVRLLNVVTHSFRLHQHHQTVCRRNNYFDLLSVADELCFEQDKCKTWVCFLVWLFSGTCNFYSFVIKWCFTRNVYVTINHFVFFRVFFLFFVCRRHICYLCPVIFYTQNRLIRRINSLVRFLSALTAENVFFSQPSIEHTEKNDRYELCCGLHKPD